MITGTLYSTVKSRALIHLRSTIVVRPLDAVLKVSDQENNQTWEVDESDNFILPKVIPSSMSSR